MNAQEIATKAHEGQFRRDGVTPYIKHPEEVASFFEEGSILWEIAWLHDVLEDTEWNDSSLYEQDVSFKTVLTVNYLTHKKGVSYRNYILSLKGDSHAQGLARRVKLIDIAVNLGDSPTPKQVKKYAEALKVLCS